MYLNQAFEGQQYDVVCKTQIALYLSAFGQKIVMSQVGLQEVTGQRKGQ